jgi:hypothetical protein
MQEILFQSARFFRAESKNGPRSEADYAVAAKMNAPSFQPTLAIVRAATSDAFPQISLAKAVPCPMKQVEVHWIRPRSTDELNLIQINRHLAL